MSERYMIVEEKTDLVLLSADDLDILARAAGKDAKTRGTEIIREAKIKGVTKVFKLERA